MIEYCFSDPIKYNGPVGVDNYLEGMLVFLAPKEASYPKTLDKYECTDQEYGDLQDTGIYGSEKNPFAFEVRDHVFWIVDENLGYKGIKDELTRLGFSYNPSLNKLLEDWIAERQKEGLEASKAPKASSRFSLNQFS